MTDAPKRIYAEFMRKDFGRINPQAPYLGDICDETYDGGPLEYVRADLARPRFGPEEWRIRQDDHRDLMRAAHEMCRSEPGVYHLEAQRDDSAHWPEFDELWELCKDYDPTPE